MWKQMKSDTFDNVLNNNVLTVWRSTREVIEGLLVQNHICGGSAVRVIADFIPIELLVHERWTLYEQREQEVHERNNP